MNSQTIDALRREAWSKTVYADAIDATFFSKKGMMGNPEEGDNHIVSLLSDLEKQPGDTVTLPFVSKLTGAGVSGDDELEGNEESMDSYAEQIQIGQIRNAVRLKGRLDEQKSAFSLRKQASAKLKDWLKEFIEVQFFLKLGGVNNPSLTMYNSAYTGRVVGANSTWSNTPDYIPDAHEAAGTGARYLCANASGTASLATTDLITPELISKLKVKAQLAEPRIRPLEIDGEELYVMFIHPCQAYDLRNNAVWAQAQREAGLRGKENPIFSGAFGIWDGVVIHVHKYVPFLDASVAGNSFRGVATGTDAARDMFRAILCGKQALGMAQCANPNGWAEETFDFGNKHGFAVGFMGGIQKVMFNSLEYGVVVLDTYATPI